MKLMIFVVMQALFQISVAQDLKIFLPELKPLDFGQDAQAEWVLRDKVLEDLGNGNRSWDELTENEKAVLMKYGEVYQNIWDIVGEGCSWYCGGGPEKVTASSYLQSQGNNTYTPENAHDLDYKNAWVEGVEGYGIGEFLRYHFAAECPRITDIIVVNGYVKSNSAWASNSRVKKLKVYYNDQPVGILALEDRIAEQRFKIGKFGHGDRSDFESLKTRSPWTLKFEIMEVYEGDRYADTVIAEIFFGGIDIH